MGMLNCFLLRFDKNIVTLDTICLVKEKKEDSLRGKAAKQPAKAILNNKPTLLLFYLSLCLFGTAVQSPATCVQAS